MAIFMLGFLFPETKKKSTVFTPRKLSIQMGIRHLRQFFPKKILLNGLIRSWRVYLSQATICRAVELMMEKLVEFCMVTERCKIGTDRVTSGTCSES